jgi:hypothetical protein
VPEPYRSPDWVLVPAKPVWGLNTNEWMNQKTRSTQPYHPRLQTFPLDHGSPTRWPPGCISGPRLHFVNCVDSIETTQYFRWFYIYFLYITVSSVYVYTNYCYISLTARETDYKNGCGPLSLKVAWLCFRLLRRHSVHIQEILYLYFITFLSYLTAPVQNLHILWYL